MKRKVNNFELIMAFSQILLLAHQLLCQLNVDQMVLSLIIGGFFVLNTIFEGNRWYIMFWASSYILNLYQSFFHKYTSTNVLYVSATLTAIHLFLVWYFPLFEFPQVFELNDLNKAQPFYNVSCANFPLDEQNSSSVTVYYPTQAESSLEEGNVTLFGSEYWGHLYKTIQKEYKIPPFILEFGNSAIKKYKVKAQMNLPIISSHNLKPIIFSHGFMGSRTLYSIINKQLASLGYVIFCVEHYDNIKEHEVDSQKERIQKRLKLKQLKEKELDIRTSKIKSVIDLIQNENQLNRLFGQNISLDKNGIILIGHSYGGATAQCSAFKYQEHIKGVVCLDPWLFPMKDDYLQQKMNVPLLYINSETFSSTMKWAELDERNNKVFKNSQQVQKSFNCYIKDMDHIQQGDIGLVIPSEGNLANLIRYPKRTLEFNLYNAKLIELFLKNIVFSTEENEDNIENHKYLKEKIFVPLEKDSQKFFRQEFNQQYDEDRNMYCLEFKGTSPY